DRRHQVGQRLSGAGAGLDGEMVAVVDGLLHRLDHRDLTLPLAPSESVDGGGEQGVDWWEMGVRHGTKRYPHSGVRRAGRDGNGCVSGHAHPGIRGPRRRVPWDTGGATPTGGHMIEGFMSGMGSPV